MHSEKSTKCTACNMPRVKEAKPEQYSLKEKDLMKLSKATAEAVERLTTEEEDELMEYPIPAAEQELQAERDRLVKIHDYLVELEASEEAIQQAKAKINKLPKVQENQNLKDLVGLTAAQLKLKEAYTRLAGACNQKEAAFVEEETARAAEMQKELKEAEEEHKARLEAIKNTAPGRLGAD